MASGAEDWTENSDRLTRGGKGSHGIIRGHDWRFGLENVVILGGKSSFFGELLLFLIKSDKI